jgi:hypothetical protein
MSEKKYRCALEYMKIEEKEGNRLPLVEQDLDRSMMSEYIGNGWEVIAAVPLAILGTTKEILFVFRHPD